MNECYSCGVIFEVEFDEDFDSAEVSFCPACGEKLDIELNLSDDMTEGYPV